MHWLRGMQVNKAFTNAGKNVKEKKHSCVGLTRSAIVELICFEKILLLLLTSVLKCLTCPMALQQIAEREEQLFRGLITYMGEQEMIMAVSG